MCFFFTKSARRALKHPRNLTKVIYIQMNENTLPPPQSHLNFNQNKRLGSVLYKSLCGKSQSKLYDKTNWGIIVPKAKWNRYFFNHDQFKIKNY